MAEDLSRTLMKKIDTRMMWTWILAVFFAGGAWFSMSEAVENQDVRIKEVETKTDTHNERIIHIEDDVEYIKERQNLMYQEQKQQGAVLQQILIQVSQRGN
jgi:hypothetical protein